MSAAEPFDSIDAENVVDHAVRLYWDSALAWGAETIPYDDLDPVRRNEVRDSIMRAAPFIIKALKAAIVNRTSIAIPDVIPSYFFDGGKGHPGPS
jgi:hypothetical protein